MIDRFHFTGDNLWIYSKNAMLEIVFKGPYLVSAEAPSTIRQFQSIRQDFMYSSPRVLTDTQMSMFDRVLRQEVAHDKGGAKIEVSCKRTSSKNRATHIL
jgi:hypothetical protein